MLSAICLELGVLRLTHSNGKKLFLGLALQYKRVCGNCANDTPASTCKDLLGLALQCTLPVILIVGHHNIYG